MLRYVSRRNPHVLEFLAPVVSSRRCVNAGVVTTQYRERPRTLVSSSPTVSSVSHQNNKERISLLSGLHATVPDADVVFFNECILRLRQSLEARDLERAWRYWSQLKERHLLILLGPQLRGYSVLLAKLCPKTLKSGWAEKIKAVETMALYAAGHGAVDALVACMATRIRGGDSCAALDLYRRYLHDLDETGIYSLPPDIRDDEDSLGELESDPSPLSSRSTVHPRVLLAAITAHALHDTFHATLCTFMQSPTIVPQHIMKEFLSQIPDRTLRSRTESYVLRLRIARYLFDPRLLTHRTCILANNMDDKALEMLYNTVIAGLDGEEAYIAVRQTEITERRPVALDEKNWAAFLTAFLKCDRRDLGASLWSDMQRFGLEPTAISWTALLDGYDAMKAPEDAEKAWDIMITQRTEPSALTYRAIMSTLFNARKPENAIKYFGLFQQRLAEGWSPDEKACLLVYNTVLHGLLICGREGDAHALLQRLREKGPKPDITSYNTFLRHHGRRGEFRQVSRILDQINEEGFIGDVYTFSTVLSALLKIGRTDGTDLVLKLMRKQNIEPNTAIFSAIVDHQIRESTEEGLRGAMDLLRRMEQSMEAQPNDVTYTGMLAGLHRQKWENASLAEECKHHVLEQMKKRGIQFNRTTYHILLEACLGNMNPEGLQEALGLYKEMVQRKIGLSYDTWYVLLRGLISREAWEVADELVRDLKRQRAPYGALENLVLRIGKRSA